ncbi:hypothetical protein O6H91_07G011600 [Diphasiastrum complanatum]|uniref:Uncharacterized protein n=1 Tax=Diphasiastrum complanatum TaxID=34168 RepID=A0ACC2D2G3_DIPCM|nr:hypothetical protein O6H91_07G011600 [Diphasiastrum complanatum]
MRGDMVAGALGLLVLAHAVYSTIRYRGSLKLMEEEFVRAPPQVLLELLVSLGLCFWAALRVPGSFLPILLDAQENRVRQLSDDLDFMIFNHRGKLFAPKFEVKFRA